MGKGLEVVPQAMPPLNQTLIGQRLALARHHLNVLSNNERNSQPVRKSWTTLKAILSTLEVMACHYRTLMQHKSSDHPQAEELERLEADLDELGELKACVYATVGSTRPTRDMQPSQRDLNVFFKNTRKGKKVTYTLPQVLENTHPVQAGAGVKSPAHNSKVQGGAVVKSPAPKSKVQAVSDGKTPDTGRLVKPTGGATTLAVGSQDLIRKGVKKGGGDLT